MLNYHISTIQRPTKINFKKAFKLKVSGILNLVNFLKNIAVFI